MVYILFELLSFKPARRRSVYVILQSFSEEKSVFVSIELQRRCVSNIIGTGDN